jgi:para-aminobenzoate synthetase / 4-amino-4-deoxychorismate lyase
MVAQPAVEGQQNHERHEPERRAQGDDAPGIDLHRRWHDEIWHVAKRNAMKLRCVDLGPGPSADDLVRRVAEWDGLVCLRGDWAGGTPLLTSHPTLVLAPQADAIAALARQPALRDADRDAIGGGWFGRLAFDGPSYLAFHDHVVRLVGGRWRFEALWQADREAALAERLAAWRAAVSADSTPSPRWRVGEFHGSPVADHLCAVERAVELIRAGELYQVNVCTRLAADFAGSAAGLFADTAAALEPRYGALVGSGSGAVVSLSPELFLRRRGRDVVSAPIKGTLPRHAGDDNAAALRRSVKDAAENVMIVDLVRNDLGRVCETGSVRAAALLEVQPHPGVWHLVSTVAGRLRADADDADLLRATFPPGSVTGAPKLRALHAIADLEPVSRGSYTGAIGFASPLWGAEFSVAIRTFEIADGRIELGVGGGITADSVPMLEWQECLHKARPLIAATGGRLLSAGGGSPRGPLAPLGPVGDAHASSLVPRSRDGGLFARALIALDAPFPDAGLGLLETILGLDGVPVRLADHLARLDRSSRELYRVGVTAELAERVGQAAKAFPVGRAVLRVVLRPDGEVAISAEPVGPPSGPTAATVATRAGGLWRHKWADRRWAAGADTAVFVAADGAVLETVRGNVFLIEPDGTLVTPPLRDDLLPGVTRRALLDLARDEGRPTVLRTFDAAELIARPAFWTSSLSGAVPIHRLDEVDLPRADGVIAGFAAALFGGTSTLR